MGDLCNALSIPRALRLFILKSKYKVEQSLLGAKDGANLVFVTPTDFLEETIQVYLNGIRLCRGVGGDYTVSESGGPGAGFDTITLDVSLAPIAGENLFADYIEE